MWSALNTPATEVQQHWTTSIDSGSVLDFVERAQPGASELARQAAQHSLDAPPQLRRAYELASEIATRIQELVVLHERFRNERVDATLTGDEGADARADDLMSERDGILYELRSKIPALRTELDATTP